MTVGFAKKVVCVGILALTMGIVLGGSVPSIGQEGKTEKAAKKVRGRLPAYYGDIVSVEQREKIYEVQRKYQPQITELNEQLLELVKKQNEEIESILSPEQKEKLKMAQAAGAAKKKKKAKGSTEPAAATSASATGGSN